MEFETYQLNQKDELHRSIRIYSIGVWNSTYPKKMLYLPWLEFTPLEFETIDAWNNNTILQILEFTPLEFETW